MTFKKAYFDIFSETLKEYGFICHKKSGRFFRVINGEIVQFIKYRAGRPTVKGHRSFTIKAGMVSVYCQTLADDRLEWSSSDMHYLAYSIYGEEKSGSMPIDYEYTNENMTDMLRTALEHTKEIILPRFDEVCDLSAYIHKWALPVKRSSISGADKFASDSLVLILTDCHDDFKEQLERDQAEIKRILTSQNRLEILDSECKLLYDSIITDIVLPRDKVFADPKLYERALEEAEQRRQANILTLNEYGIIL